jgi:hypothetical protein
LATPPDPAAAGIAGTRQAMATARRINLLIETFESFIRNKLP